jgi:hypothetical protein
MRAVASKIRASAPKDQRLADIGQLVQCELAVLKRPIQALNAKFRVSAQNFRDWVRRTGALLMTDKRFDRTILN